MRAQTCGERGKERCGNQVLVKRRGNATSTTLATLAAACRGESKDLEGLFSKKTEKGDGKKMKRY